MFQLRSFPLVARSKNWLAGVPRSRATLAEVAAVVGLAGLFSVAYVLGLREPFGADDCSYFQFVMGKNAGAAHHQQRYVLLASVWLAQAAFGYTMIGYYAVSYSYGLGLVLASYLLARRFVGPLWAFVAGVMVIALPDVLAFSSLLMPDVPGQFWLVLGLWSFLRFFTAEARSLPWGAVSALSFFCAASVKESLVLALLGLICFPLAFPRSREKWLRFACVAGGVAVLEAVQTMILWAVFGDPLHRLHSVSSGHLPQMETYARTPGKMPQNIDWAHLATRFVDQAFSDPAHRVGPLIGYWPLLLGSFVIALALAIWKRQRLLLAFAGFVLLAYCALTFTIISVDPLIPVVRTIDRYFIVVLTLLPIFIVAGWGLLFLELSKRVSTKRGRRVCTALVAAVCLLYTSTAYTAATHHLTHDKRLIANGGTRVARTGESVKRYVRQHPEIQRILGPKLIRGGDFSWELDAELRGMPEARLARLEKHRHDLLLAEQPALMMQHSNLAWRRVGKVGRLELVHIGMLGDRHAAGEWELLVLNQKQLSQASRVSVSLRVTLRAENVRLEPLQLVAYEKRRRTLERKPWTQEGDIYTVELESKPFRTRRLKACTLRVSAKGRGTFEILEREVDAASVRERR